MYRNAEKRLNAKQAIQGVLKYSDQHNNLLQKYNTEFFITYFDRYSIEELEQKIQRTKKLNKKGFIQNFTSFILHKPQQTLFLVMGLLDIFDRIVAQIKTDSEITVKDFTWFLCQSISSKESEEFVNSKQLPLEQVNPDPTRVRDIDVNPPNIIPHPEKEIPKISKNFKKKEKKVDSSKPLHNFFYNHQRKEIITLGRLASHITIFNLHFKKCGEIEPACFKLYDKNMAIMSMGFSQKHQRIGCIIANLGMAFWDYEDDFQTQKLIKKIIGDQIYYLPLLDEWITTNQNTIYLWDLKEERVKQKFGQEKATSINDIKQITHLRCMAVSYTLNDNFKWLYIYENKGKKLGSRLKLSHVGAQKIHYNKYTQTLLLLGMNELPLYSIDKISYDASLLTTLKGHDTIITSIADLGEGLIITGDDRGFMKVWDLKNMRCQQVIKVANTINKIECIENTLLYSDTRINMMKIQQLTQQLPLSEMFGIKHFFRFQNPVYEAFIFTTVNCRIYDLRNGRIKHVIEICIDEQEIITVEKIHSGFLLSTTKDYLMSFSESMKFRWKMSMAKYFSEEVQHIRYDPVNKFVTAISKEASILVWNEKLFLEEGPRKMMQNNLKDQHYFTTCFDLSEKYSLMVTGQKNSTFKIWDYQSCKLCHIIQIPSNSCAIKVSKDYPLIAVACTNEKVYIYRFQRNQNVFSVYFLHCANLRYPENSLNSLLSIKTFSEIKPSNTRRQDLKNLSANNIIFYHHIKHNMLILSYGRGSIISFNISRLIFTHFRQKPQIKFTLNIQRPIRENYEKQLNKNQYRTTPCPIDNISGDQFLPAIFNKIIHKDTITDLQIFQNTYVSSLSIDGYFKMATIQKCQNVCTLCIKFPLPHQWKIQILKYQQISKKLYEALRVIEDVLQDKQVVEKSNVQMDFLAISKLMHKICHHKPSPNKKKHKTVKLLKQQFSVSDIRQIRPCQSEQSLKCLEAYRRVKLIKQVKKIEYNQDDLQKKGGNSLLQKQQLQKLLAPNYFPSLYCRQQNQQIKEKVEQLYAKSMNISLSNSRQKLLKHDTNTKERIKVLSLQKNDQTKRKNIQNKGSNEKLPLRSLSQSLRSSFITQALFQENRRSLQTSKDIKDQLKSKDPLKSLSVFMKSLNQKIPKQNQIKKHLRKFSNFNART